MTSSQSSVFMWKIRYTFQFSKSIETKDHKRKAECFSAALLTVTFGLLAGASVQQASRGRTVNWRSMNVSLTHVETRPPVWIN